MSIIKFYYKELFDKDLPDKSLSDLTGSNPSYKFSAFTSKMGNYALDSLLPFLYKIGKYKSVEDVEPDYKGSLFQGNSSNNPDRHLSLDGKPSEHFAASNAIKRNNIMLETILLDYNRNEYKIQIELIDVKIKVTQQNTIVSTALVGRRGSVKEYIQAKDYAINIKGSVFTNSQTDFPGDKVVLLKQILEVPNRIKVHSRYLELFGITQMVFLNGDYDQSETKFVNQLAFSFVFESDDDYDLVVI